MEAQKKKACNGARPNVRRRRKKLTTPHTLEVTYILTTTIYYGGGGCMGKHRIYVLIFCLHRNFGPAFIAAQKAPQGKARIFCA